MVTNNCIGDNVHDEVGTIDYQGESPDEQALVAATSTWNKNYQLNGKKMYIIWRRCNIY